MDVSLLVLHILYPHPFWLQDFQSRYMRLWFCVSYVSKKTCCNHDNKTATIFFGMFTLLYVQFLIFRHTSTFFTGIQSVVSCRCFRLFAFGLWGVVLLLGPQSVSIRFLVHPNTETSSRTLCFFCGTIWDDLDKISAVCHCRVASYFLGHRLHCKWIPHLWNWQTVL